MPECERMRPLLPLLLLGDAAPEEQAATEAHLAVCAACRAERERVARVVDEVRRDLCDVPIPEPLPPDLWWRSRLPDAGSAEQEEALPAVWRGVTVALQTMDVPAHLSADRIEAIFKRVESQSETRRVFRMRRPLAAIAAAAAVAVAGSGIWYAGVLRQTDGNEGIRKCETERAQGVLSAVTVVESWEVTALMLPPTAPGKISLGKGMARMRLPSGVELVLVGPLELDVESWMEVRLNRGQLLAWVPPRAYGFTVHAEGLSVMDIGTVFSVMADGQSSSLFVLKGLVQVSGGSHGRDRSCGEGKGYLSVGGKLTPYEAVGVEVPDGLGWVKGDVSAASPETVLSRVRRIRDRELLARGIVPGKGENEMKMTNTLAALTTAILVDTAAVKTAAASDIEFTATPSGDWSVVGNWNEGARVPGVGDTAIVRNRGTLLVTQNQTAEKLVLGRNGNGNASIESGRLSTANTYVGDVGCTAVLIQTNGEHVITGWLYLGESSNARATYTLSGGMLQSLSGRIGFRGLSDFNQQGGTNTVRDDLLINAEVSSGVCSYTLSGGWLTVGDLQCVGYYNSGSFIQNGGTQQVGRVRVGENGVGSYALSEGTLSVTNATLGVYVGYNKPGIFEQSGGKHVIAGPLELGKSAGVTGTYRLSGGTLSLTTLHLARVFNSTARFELAGGEMTVSSGIETYGGNAAFVFTGGTLHSGFISMNTFTNQGGRLAPGIGIGKTTFYGNYHQQPGAALEIELNASGIDEVANITEATLDGSLEVILRDGFAPAAGWTSAPFLKTVAGITGTFSSVPRLWQVVRSPDGKQMCLRRQAPPGTVISLN